MYCQNCGKEVTGKFCSNCGAETVLNEKVPKNKRTVKILNIVSLLLSELTVILYVFFTYNNAEIVADIILSFVFAGALLVLNFLPFLSELLPIKKGIIIAAHGLRLFTVAFTGFIGINSLVVLFLAFIVLIIDIITLIANIKNYKTKDKAKPSAVIISVVLVLILASPSIFGWQMRNYRNAVCPNFVINGYEVKNWQADYIDENYTIRNGINGELTKDKLSDFKVSSRQSEVMQGVEYEKDYSNDIRESISVDDGYLTTYSVSYYNVSIDNKLLAEIMHAYNEILGGELIFSDVDKKLSYTFEELTTASFAETTHLFYDTPTGSEIYIYIHIDILPSGLCDVSVFYIFD